MSIDDIPEIGQMSIAEKILLVEDLWDHIASCPEEIKVPKKHQEELERRLKRYKSNPGELLSLEELQDRIEKNK